MIECARTELVLQQISNEDAVCLEGRAPYQRDGVCLGVGCSQDGHLLRNCENNSNVKASIAIHLTACFSLNGRFAKHFTAIFFPHFFFYFLVIQNFEMLKIIMSAFCFFNLSNSAGWVWHCCMVKLCSKQQNFSFRWTSQGLQWYQIFPGKSMWINDAKDINNDRLGLNILLDKNEMQRQ